MRKQDRIKLFGRAVFVGCSICGETERTLRNYAGKKLCPECFKKIVSGSDTERKKNAKL